MAKRKTHSLSFKSRVALEAIRGDQTIAELGAKYQVHSAMVTKWKKQAVDGMADTFSRGSRPARDASYEARIKELFERSVCVATALTPYLGYSKVSELVKEARKNKRPFMDVVLEKKLFLKKELNKILDPKSLTRP